MTKHPRYRVEDGVPCVDVVADEVSRLFDNRDPAPFRERDLDPDLVDYLRDASEDLRARGRFRIVFWMANPCEPQTIEHAMREHFGYEIERLTRVRRRARGAGFIALAIAVVVIGGLLALAPIVEHRVGGWLGTALRETLVISSWVLAWRPVEVLVYDAVPFHTDRATLERLVAAPIEVRAGKGPAAT